jgi:hypothetical protein
MQAMAPASNSAPQAGHFVGVTGLEVVEADPAVGTCTLGCEGGRC